MVAGPALWRKIQYFPKLRANKSVQPPSYEYSTIFQSNRPFLLNFFPQIRALGGEIVPLRKKFRNIPRKSY
jgi:hypothetical protein